MTSMNSIILIVTIMFMVLGVQCLELSSSVYSPSDLSSKSSPAPAPAAAAAAAAAEPSSAFTQEAVMAAAKLPLTKEETDRFEQEQRPNTPSPNPSPLVDSLVSPSPSSSTPSSADESKPELLRGDTVTIPLINVESEDSSDSVGESVLGPEVASSLPPDSIDDESGFMSPELVDPDNNTVEAQFNDQDNDEYVGAELTDTVAAPTQYAPATYVEPEVAYARLDAASRVDGDESDNESESDAPVRTTTELSVSPDGNTVSTTTVSSTSSNDSFEPFHQLLNSMLSRMFGPDLLSSPSENENDGMQGHSPLIGNDDSDMTMEEQEEEKNEWKPFEIFNRWNADVDDDMQLKQQEHIRLNVDDALNSDDQPPMFPIRFHRLRALFPSFFPPPPPPPSAFDSPSSNPIFMRLHIRPSPDFFNDEASEENDMKQTDNEEENKRQYANERLDQLLPQPPQFPQPSTIDSMHAGHPRSFPRDDMHHADEWSSAPPPPHSHHARTWMIVAAVLGSVALLALIVGVGVLVYRRRKSRSAGVSMALPALPQHHIVTNEYQPLPAMPAQPIVMASVVQNQA